MKAAELVAQAPKNKDIYMWLWDKSSEYKHSFSDVGIQLVEEFDSYRIDATLEGKPFTRLVTRSHIETYGVSRALAYLELSTAYIRA